MVSVQIKAIAYLKDYLGKKERIGLLVEQDTTVGEVLAKLYIPNNEVMWVLVNGLKANQLDIINPGDEITLLPPLAGG